MRESDQNSVDMEAVYQQYAKLVYRFLYAHTHDAQWSEELTQETFLRAVTSIRRYDGSCKLSVWLCQIARHVLYQELRKKKRADFVELPEHVIDDVSPDGERDVLQRVKRVVYRESDSEPYVMNVLVYTAETIPFLSFLPAGQEQREFEITIPDAKGYIVYLACPEYDRREVYDWKTDHDAGR